MPTLIITRGLPASGKSTWARRHLAEQTAAGNRIARVNRDEVRDLLHGDRTYDNNAERQVSIAQQAQVEALLRDGVDVIVDDMHLRSRYVRDWMILAARVGAEVEVRDEFLAVPVDECVRRDAERTGREQIGEANIRAQYGRFLAGRKGVLPVPVLETGTDDLIPYVPPVDAPKAILCDVDGTVAIMSGRSPYDETRVHEDLPNPSVITAVRAMHAAGHRVVFVSARTEGCRSATEKWLTDHVGVPFEALHMRQSGDSRKDSIVKTEIFDREIRHRWNVAFVLDDRNQVVQRWRALGLPVFQVADGAF